MLRKHREAAEELKTLQRLAKAVGTTHATLSRWETGKAPYEQDLLERVAAALGTTPGSILERDPADPTGDILTVLEQADADTRREIVEVAKTIIKTRAKK